MTDCPAHAFQGCTGPTTCTRCHVQQINLDERQAAFNLSAGLSTLAMTAVIALVFIGAVAVSLQGRENWKAVAVAGEPV